MTPSGMVFVAARLRIANVGAGRRRPRVSRGIRPMQNVALQSSLDAMRDFIDSVDVDPIG